MRLTGNVLQKEEYIITCIGFVFMSIVVILLLAIAFYTACFDSAIVASVILVLMGSSLTLGFKYLRYTYEMNEQGVYFKDHKGIVKKQILWGDVTHVQEYPFRFSSVRYKLVYKKYILILANGKIFESENIFKAIKEDDVICIPKTIDAVRVLCEYLKPR